MAVAALNVDCAPMLVDVDKGVMKAGVFDRDSLDFCCCK